MQALRRLIQPILPGPRPRADQPTLPPHTPPTSLAEGSPAPDSDQPPLEVHVYIPPPFHIVGQQITPLRTEPPQPPLAEPPDAPEDLLPPQPTALRPPPHESPPKEVASPAAPPATSAASPLPQAAPPTPAPPAPRGPGNRPAVFLDRDGTIIRDVGYLADPDGIDLLPGAVEGLLQLQQEGYLLVVVTNQGGVALGRMSLEQVHAVHRRLAEVLAGRGVQLTALYFSPYHPRGSVAPYNREHDSRKPGPGMLLQAAGELHIDLPASWIIGDSARDIEAGLAAGVRTCYLRLAVGNQPPPQAAHATAQTWDEVVRHVLAARQAGRLGHESPEPVG